MEKRGLFKASAVAATTATLVPATGQEARGDFTDTVVSVVVTFTTARDAVFFDLTNREYELVLRRR